MTTALAPRDIAAEAAALAAATALDVLGRQINADEAARLGTAVVAALTSGGWAIHADMNRRRHPDHPELRPWDLSILAGLARGHTVAEIGTMTGVPSATVRHRVQRLRTRIGAANAAHAVAIAYERGWMAHLAPEPRGPIRLSRRQLQTLALMAAGHTNEAIGRHLRLTPNSVVTYVRRLYAVLDASRAGCVYPATRPHAVALGYQHGLLPVPLGPEGAAEPGPQHCRTCYMPLPHHHVHCPHFGT
ncbi:response regulator transcription factor [Streptomyces sp. NPDC057854]|uniref:helix-turn-helix transcriptional regulator n=1 Tax=unclassified Streptomyces TaxID=2593676 RepID=UPI003699831E